MKSVNSWRLAGVVTVAIAGWLACAGQASADAPAPAPGVHTPNALCLACHQQNLTVGDVPAEHRTVDAIRGWAFAASVHKEMNCEECHADQAAIPHPNANIAPALRATVICAGCHADAYEGYR